MNYFIRIQLNAVNGVSANAKTYDSLHALMEKAEAVRTITGNARGYSETYDLPHAEYTVETIVDVVTVRDIVDKIVSTIWSESEILVVQWTECAWKLSPHVPKIQLSRATTALLGFNI